MCCVSFYTQHKAKVGLNNSAFLMLGPVVGKRLRPLICTTQCGCNCRIKQQKGGKTLLKRKYRIKTFDLIYPITHVFYQENIQQSGNINTHHNHKNTHRYRNMHCYCYEQHTGMLISTDVLFVE